MQPPIRDWTGQLTDWEHARGLWTIAYNCYFPLVRASVEEFAGALAEGAEVWERDVLGRPVVSQRDALFVFRLRGHPWSIAVEGWGACTPYGHKGYAWERSLSLRLHCPVILYGTSDTCCSIGYTLIEGGAVVEDFFAEDDENRPATGRSSFTSTRREVRLDQIENIYDFVHQFLTGQDAFDPGITFNYFFNYEQPGLGESRTVENPGFVSVSPGGVEVRDTPPIERVDYLVLKPSE